MDRKPDSFQETIYYEPDSLFLFHHNFSSDDYANHWHNAVEIIMPIQNTYAVSINRQIFNLREHDILIIPPGELHEIKSPKGKGRRILVQFSIEALNTIRGFIKSSYIYMNPWLITPENSPELHQIMKTMLFDMLDEFLNRDILYNIAVTSKIIEITLHLTRKKQEENDSQYEALIVRREHTERFNECIDYINQHYNEDLTLETVAQAACFSKFHFSRWFREFANLSFHDYLTKLRIDKAEAMLLSTSRSVTEIALEAGFQSTNTFNRLFRKSKNCTPTEYRHLYHLKQQQQTALSAVDEPDTASEKVYVSKPPTPAGIHTPGEMSPALSWTDIPDPDVIRVNDVYYMVSTTMYFNPGIPVMKSRDLKSWEIVNYVYDILDDSDACALRGGASAYGKGSWAACLRYNKGTFYVAVASFTTKKTYFFQTEDIENGPWRRYVIDEVFHDLSMLFDDDGRVYVVHGGGTIRLVELNAEVTGILPGGEMRVIIENADVGGADGLPAEGSHIYKIDDRYYLFMIAWPKSGSARRIQLCYRADRIEGPYEGRVVLDDDMGYWNRGVAQGGIVETPDGKWYAMLHQDHGSEGRVPVLASVTWEDGWPVFGNLVHGVSGSDVVISDEFYPADIHKDYAAANGLAYRYMHLSCNHDAEVNSDETELLVNNSFEDGLADWGVNEVAEIMITDEESFEGRPVLKVINRSTTGSGPHQVITGKVTPGGVYEALAWVMYTSGPPQKTFNICIRNGKTWQGARIMASATLIKGEWGVLRGTYTLPENADLTETSIYIETPWFEKPRKEKDMMDFYVGGVSVKAKPLQYNSKAWPGENDPETPCLALAWQWNHNPDHRLWTLNERFSHLRLKSGYLCRGLLDARNTLTQRTLGPRCAGVVSLDVSEMRDGDYAGLAALQELYGYVGVKMVNGERFIIMTNAESGQAVQVKSVPLQSDRVYLRVEFEFGDEDCARFYYSLDEVSWHGIGDVLHMKYRLSHFTGYRFALFYYSTQTVGGYVDFDYFRLCGLLSQNDSKSIALNASFDGDSVADGVKNAALEVSIHMDALPESGCKGIHISMPIPAMLDVADVVFCDENVKGDTAYTVDGRQLVIAVTGDVSFANHTSDLFATLCFTVCDYVAEDTVITLQPDYIFIDGVDAYCQTRDMQMSVTLKALATNAAAKAPGCANPLISHKYGADPWALEYDGRVYMYLTGDKHEYNEHGQLVDNTYGKINTICVISSADLVNWTDHGEIVVAGMDGAAKWARHSWAPSVGYKCINGADRFFLYFANDASNIGVLTADSPIGPWSDPIGGPLIHRGIKGVETVTWCFDPAVLTDDDGQSYLYFGGGLPSRSEEDVAHPRTARVIRLGDDMISTIGDALLVDAPALFEDSGIHKYGGKYYYSYCSNFEGPHPRGYPGFGEIAYMTSDHPMGPFTYVGTILKNPTEFFGVGGNNHHCIFTFRGEWYIAYHAQTLAKATGRVKGYRSPHINCLSYYGNGQMRPVTADMKGVAPVKTLSPYDKVPAATIAWCAGIKTEPHNEARDGTYVTRIRNGMWLAVANVDFGEIGASRFSARCASRNAGAIEIRLDSVQGEVIGTLGCGATGGDDMWAVRSCEVRLVCGVQNIFFVFKGDSEDDLFNIDYWQFE